MMNEFFPSVFSPKPKLSITDNKIENPILTIFDILKRTIQKIVNQVDVTESRGPNGLPRAFFQKTYGEISKILRKFFKNIRRLRIFRDHWKTAAVTPNRKKRDRQKIAKYRPVSPLDNESKIFAKCILIALYIFFTFYLNKHQHGFLQHRSVLSKMLSSFRRILEALHSDPNSENVAFYTDLSKAFDKVPHYEIIQKVSQIRVGGSFLQIWINYIENRKQCVRIDNGSSRTLNVTSGVPQGSPWPVAFLHNYERSAGSSNLF